jgi:SAM-dependent methyltransferase
MTEFRYVGSELTLFAEVRNWKRYWSAQIKPFIAGDVIEVGAGIGSSTPFMDCRDRKRWVCLERDPVLLAQLAETLSHKAGNGSYETLCGTMRSIAADQMFDTVIYIDVLEHIADDREELSSAAAHLRAGGRIIVLSPAHQRLFTPFDTAIGHFRRYNRAMLRSISPTGVSLEHMIYLDSAGLAASIANLLLLHQSMPTERQLRFWDQWMVPVSRVFDRILLHTVGKSILAVWRKTT